MVCKETAACPKHGNLLPDEVKAADGSRFCVHCDAPVTLGRVEKMSKSKKNVIDPNILLEKYGADTTRFFCLFAAPPERDLEWSEQGVEGGYRFLNRVWRLATEWMDQVKDISAFDGSPAALEGAIRELYKKTHQTIMKVTRDIEDRYHFNTAISAIMELFNTMSDIKRAKNNAQQARVMRFALETLSLLLSPIVPHFAEELWERLGNTSSVLIVKWPSFLEEALEKDGLPLPPDNIFLFQGDCMDEIVHETIFKRTGIPLEQFDLFYTYLTMHEEFAELIVRKAKKGAVFINYGLEKILPAPLALTRPGARLIALIKPQFEVGKDQVGKGGVVRDPALHQAVCERINGWLAAQPAWRVLGVTESPITGPEGNVEFLIAAERDSG